MATATINTRSIQGESLDAVTDRLINLALKEGVIDFAGGSFEVTEDTGANMQVKVGSGSAHDRAVIEGDLAGQGNYVIEHQDPDVTLVIAAADATNPRIDVAIARVRDDTFDSSGLDESDIEIVEGTPAASPTAPSIPNTALKLAEITVGAGVTAITDSDIDDFRYEAPTKGQLVETVIFTGSGTFSKADYPWLAKVVAKVQGAGGSAGSVTSASGQSNMGLPGGGGGYAESGVPVEDLSTDETVTVGTGGASPSANQNGNAGGNSSFGSHVIGEGGGGGGRSMSTDVVRGFTPNAAGGDGTGDLVIPGNRGGISIQVESTRAMPGKGGDSQLGKGGHSQNQSTTGATNGQPGLGRGGGGSGGVSVNNGGTGLGGVGTNGIVILELYA